jgi:hypothetical protein
LRPIERVVPLSAGPGPAGPGPAGSAAIKQAKLHESRIQDGGGRLNVGRTVGATERKY